VHRVARGSLVADFLTLLGIPRVRVILIAVSAEGFLFFGAFAYVGAYLRDNFGMSYLEMGGFLASFGLGGLAYALTARRVVSRLGQRGMVLLGAIGLAGTYGLLAIGPPTATLVPIIALLGTSFYLLHNTLQTNATQMAPHARGLAVSAFASCLFLGQAGGVAVAGWCIDGVGYRPVFAAAAALLLVTALIIRRHLAPPAAAAA
jgi:predicted MFS family arabinose efflux permease